MDVKSIKGLIFKFGISYIPILIIVNIILNIFSVSNRTSAVVLVLFLVLKFWFDKYLNYKQARLSKLEFIKIFIGIYAFILVYDFITVTILINASNITISQDTLILSVITGSLINALVIFFTVYLSNRKFKNNLIQN